MLSPKKRTKRHNPALKRATCAALIAATFAVPVSAESIASIERYCTSSWRQAGIPMHDWEDCTQDTMLELLSRVPHKQLAHAIEKPQSSERRELMRSVWCVAQRWRRATQKRPVSLDLLGDWQEGTSSDTDFVDQEALSSAMQSLSSTQQQILGLFVDGNSIADIAKQLELSPAGVSDQKYKAIRSLKSHFETAQAS